MIEAEIVMKPNVRIFQVSVMPPNIDDNTTAVVIYLEISINHLPNSFFISFQYFAAKVQRKSETTKCLADFLVFCSYVKISKSAFFHPQIITDFYFWHGNPRLFQRHGFSSALILSRHFVVTACFASSRLSLLCGNEPCLYFSIALSKYSLYPSRSLAVSFFKAASIRA